VQGREEAVSAEKETCAAAAVAVSTRETVATEREAAVDLAAIDAEKRRAAAEAALAACEVGVLAPSKPPHPYPAPNHGAPLVPLTQSRLSPQ
jgi:hypothetical protein